MVLVYDVSYDQYMYGLSYDVMSCDHVCLVAVVEESMEELPSLLREAKVSDEDIGDDRLEDEEWNLLSTVK